MDLQSSVAASEAVKDPPRLTSIRDLTIVESYDPGADKPKYVTFYILAKDGALWFAALDHVPDEELYPVIPDDTSLTIAPEHLDDTSAFIKTPGLNSYESVKGTDFIPRSILEETLIMEQLSQLPHPNIVHYHGCRVRRGRITAIVLERLDKSLTQYAETPEYEKLDKPAFFAGLESAVQHIHALDLAHNDINPDNIMVRDGTPVLIDFGSCQPFGNRLQSLGSVGWYKELFYTSEKEHDEFSMNKLKEWLALG